MSSTVRLTTEGGLSGMHGQIGSTVKSGMEGKRTLGKGNPTKAIPRTGQGCNDSSAVPCVTTFTERFFRANLLYFFYYAWKLCT